MESLSAKTPRLYEDTFGLEPHYFEREIPQTIRSLTGALHRYEREGGSLEEMRELFSDVYPEKKIAEDWAQVEKLEQVFATDKTVEDHTVHLYSMVFEMIVQDVANLWFPDCVIWRASKYDDYMRQTDLFLDIPLGDETVTLAIDVTTSKVMVGEKIGRAMDEYRRGSFHGVEYFASDTDDDRPRGRAYVPRVAMGAPYRDVARLAFQYNTWRGARGEKKVAATRALQAHPLAGQLFEEVIHQLDQAQALMRTCLKDIPAHEAQATRRTALEGRLAHLRDTREALQQRYAAWQALRNDQEKSGNLGTYAETPANGVLEAILMT